MRNRRNFIKKFALSTTALSLMGTVFKSSKAINSIPSWYDLVDIAKWCPTVHNLQPQKIKVISENRAELYYDPKDCYLTEIQNQSSQQLQWVYLLSTYQLLQANLIMM